MHRPPFEDAAPSLSILTGGDTSAAAQLMDVVYDELRALAGGYFRGQEGHHTLQPTALVHEAFLRVAQRTGTQLQNRAHFFGVCAIAMRHILADHAKRRRAAKRGGDWSRVSLTAVGGPEGVPPIDAIELDDALNELARRNERQARIVEYRFFAGMSMREVAEVLDVSRSLVEQDWRMARAWLTVQLGQDKAT